MSASPKLFIGNLSWKTSTEDLKSSFGQFGQVIDAAIVTDRETGRSRGFGFVTYESNEAAQAAQAAMDNFELQGRQIRVNFAEQRERAPRTFNNNNGGERPYSNSGSRY